MSNPRPAECMRPSPSCSHPLPRAIMAAALLHRAAWPSPRCAAITHSNHTVVSYQCCLGCNQVTGKVTCSASYSDSKYRMHFDILTKRSPVNSKKYAVIISVLIKEFDSRFQNCQNNYQFFWFTCNSIFSWHQYITLKFSNGMY